MSTPNPMSGKDATFKKDGSALTVECLGWSVDPQGGESRYASDKTGGHRVSWPTINDYNATVRIKIPATGTVPFNRGDTFAVQFHIDGTGNNYLAGNVICLQDPITVDIGGDETLEIEYPIGPRGPLTHYGILWSGSGSSGIPNT